MMEVMEAVVMLISVGLAIREFFKQNVGRATFWTSWAILMKLWAL